MALCLAGPVLVTALGAGAVETWRWYRPASPLFVPPTAATFVDALRADDVRGANAFLHAGQQPDDLVAVNDAALTGGQWLLVSPLVWAVASDSPQSVLLLLGAGAGQVHPSDRRVACLANSLGHGEVARLLRQYQADAPGTCAEARQDGPPLTVYLSQFE